jgi:hypothetical protein
MSDLPPPIQTTPAIGEPARKSPRVPVAIGFGIGAVLWLMPVLFRNAPDYGAVGWLILAAFGAPIPAAVLSIVRKTRPFGLGLLLACGLGWLVLGAMCGGLIR